MKKEDLQAQVQQLNEQGHSIREIAKITGISKSSVGRMVKEIQDSGPGTAPGTRPATVLGSHGTSAGTASAAVPAAGRDASGTLESIKKGADASAEQPRQQENSVFEALLRGQYKYSLHSSYQDFLYSTRTFLTNNLGSEELAHSLIKSRQQRVGDFILRARNICSNCQVRYEKLFMAYVLGELHYFLGQQPELEQTERGLKLKAGVVLEQFIKQVEPMDIFTHMEDDLPTFPDTEAW
ncbi:helix-turn-helix domain-containing protein [Pontibacter silvestris]|uniref:Helix-turn-helix domain-containing protein n=1 Tax=Pontibacter silvestris TaxID=2305183 RepID=A0ABW4X0U8_9BACT|nr:helix-turn-helix domain-containing protein [Pontibacter silvestris]MCC9138911.1 helix-turn-helix domain-containing protein [Pontibacter silvestris]